MIKIEPWMLDQKQSLPLSAKIKLTQMRIRQWHDHWDGDIYVAFSGGKDSTVLLDLVRDMYKNVPAVFADTGLEYPEIREFVKEFDNVTFVKPKMSFKKVIETYGYPVISKQKARYIRDLQQPTERNEKTRLLRMGKIDGKSKTSELPAKWRFLVNAPFKISEQCCDIMKKNPMKDYQKKTGRHPIVGTMAEDSSQRRMAYIKTGCNSYKSDGMSMPMSFWVEDDIWEYIKTKNLPYCKIYDMGERRTGCMFCMFGLYAIPGENRFDRMKRTHPAQYRYCMEKLGIRQVMEYINNMLAKQKNPSLIGLQENMLDKLTV